jgi:hypothetical protein
LKPNSQPLDGAFKGANNDDAHKEDSFSHIREFNADGWHAATKEWVAGALDKGFDSMSVMQPLVDMAKLDYEKSSLKASVSTIEPSSSHCKIAEGIVSDGE